ncbi:hypothetical protein GCM10027452_01400 [Micromonospora halotolerans]
MAAFRPLAGEPDPVGPLVSSAGHPYKVPLNNFTSETELAEAVLDRLRPAFHIRREWPGRHCSGRQARIDAIIRPRDLTPWRDDVVTFGVEFKLPPAQAGTNAYTGWLARPVDYTHVDWKGLGRLRILTCPGPTLWLDRIQQYSQADSTVSLARRLSGQLGVGELVLRWTHGLTIAFNGEQVWSDRYGVVRGRTWTMAPRVGSR